MPELPEVEFCRQSLEKWTKGQRVVGYKILDGRSIRASTAARPSEGLVDAAARLGAVFAEPCGQVARHGKRLLWEFGGQSLVLHLGMTGKWTRQESRFAKLELELSGGDRLYFVDARLLGGVVPLKTRDARRVLYDGHGPDAWECPLPTLRGKRPIKVALLDQKVIAGLGNIQAMESLWRAKINPEVPAGTITGERHRELGRAIKAQLSWTLELLLKDEEITYMEEDRSLNPFWIYQRAKKPCPTCQTPIERIVQANRSTYWCPTCQPPLPGSP